MIAELKAARSPLVDLGLRRRYAHLAQGLDAWEALPLGAVAQEMAQ